MAFKSSIFRVRSGVVLASVLLGAATWSRGDELVTDFESGFGPWVPLFSGSWQIDEIDGNHVATLAVPGVDRPPVRRPRAYIFLTGHTWKDYTVTCRARTLMPPSTTRRDVVVIFGYVDDTHYYYSHISSTADAVHSVIMRVDGTERMTIHNEAVVAPALDGSWQTIRVAHGSAGSIEVFVDDLATPLMTANDASYPAGAVALGSFDDSAQFDDVSVSGSSLAAVAAEVELARVGPDRLELNYETRRGFVFQVESGESVDDFTPLGEVVLGHGGVGSLALETAGAPKQFYRVVTLYPQLAEP